MISDYYVTLLRRVVTQVPDGAGGFTESLTDSQFSGYISDLSGSEVLNNNQLGNNATLQLFTDTTLNLWDRIVDEHGVELEVVWHHARLNNRYLLKQIK